MFNKTKTSIIALALTSFLVGGLAFTAYQVGAIGDGSGHKFGFWKGGFGGFSGIDKDSEEWQAKKEEWKAKMEEFKLNMTENGGEWKGHGWGFGHFFGFKGYADEINYEVINIANGIQITITSDNPDIIQKLQDIAAKKHSHLNE